MEKIKYTSFATFLLTQLLMAEGNTSLNSYIKRDGWEIFSYTDSAWDYYNDEMSGGWFYFYLNRELGVVAYFYEGQRDNYGDLTDQIITDLTNNQPTNNNVSYFTFDKTIDFRDFDMLMAERDE